MHDPRFDRLPRWAQEHISKLVSDCAYHKKQAEQVCGTAPTKVFLEAYSGNGRVLKPLPMHSRVVFQLEGETEITVGSCDDYVEVRTSGTRAADSIQAQPQAANVLKVRPGRYW